MPQEQDISNYINGIKSKMGIETTWKLEIERGLIAKLAEAIGDPNPLWNDREYASKTRYGRIIAPPSFFGSGMMFGWEMCINPPRFESIRIPGGESQKPTTIPMLTNVVDGGSEREFYKLVGEGDVITTVSKLADVSVRESKKFGKMVFLLLENVHWNESGEMVAKCTRRVITY